jgi:hypothetical protein
MFWMAAALTGAQAAEEAPQVFDWRVWFLGYGNDRVYRVTFRQGRWRRAQSSATPCSCNHSSSIASTHTRPP